MSIEVILTDRASNQTKQDFGDDLKAASKCLMDSWTRGNHLEGEVCKDGQTLIQFN